MYRDPAKQVIGSGSITSRLPSSTRARNRCFAPSSDRYTFVDACVATSAFAPRLTATRIDSESPPTRPPPYVATYTHADVPAFLGLSSLSALAAAARVRTVAPRT